MGEAGDGLPSVRASDGEREEVVTRLQVAAGDGRLTLDELAERVDAALTAVSRADLEALTADLPEQQARLPATSKARRWAIGIMGGATQRGRWRIASRCIVVNVMGGADLDLTDATVEGPETAIVVFSLMGGSNIVVPPSVQVELSGLALMGGNELRLGSAPALPLGAPVVRVRAYSIMGGTTVKHTVDVRHARFSAPRLAPPVPPPPLSPPES